MKAIAIAIVLGCGGSSQQPVQEPKPEAVAQKPAAPSCLAVADRIAVVMSQTAGTSVEIAGVVKLRCAEDGWSDEARQCYGTAETVDVADGCEKLLTAEQKAAVDQAVDTELAASAAGQTAMTQKFEEFADQACRCKPGDADCGKQVSDDMTKWAESQPKMGTMKPDPRVEEAAKRLTECITKAMMPVESAPPPPPPPPKRRAK